MYGNAKYGIKDLGTDLEIGPEDIQATVNFVKTLPQPFEYIADGRINQLLPLAIAQ
jgi:2',3'-cyclic-nucleotide 2'-phosphodiesterase/3'-nucleotidase/5'-nucleotidase